MSLDHAPVHAEQIPALFYLGESVLYWVCTDMSQKPNLYTCEVKILKCESCYQPYPNILLSVHFMLRSGEIICGLGPFQDDSASVRVPCKF
ncbi:unnamed protein product, partial [Coregonus sp. 'balchen']